MGSKYQLSEAAKSARKVRKNSRKLSRSKRENRRRRECEKRLSVQAQADLLYARRRASGYFDIPRPKTPPRRFEVVMKPVRWSDSRW